MIYGGVPSTFIISILKLGVNIAFFSKTDIELKMVLSLNENEGRSIKTLNWIKLFEIKKKKYQI